MKYPSISLFPETGSVYVSFFDDNNDYVKINMSAECFRRLVCHTYSPFKWTDCPGLVDIGPKFLNLCHVLSQDFADVLSVSPDEIERIFKRCFQGIAPELAGLEIRDVNITVYHPSTQDADAQ